MLIQFRRNAICGGLIDTFVVFSYLHHSGAEGCFRFQSMKPCLAHREAGVNQKKEFRSGRADAMAGEIEKTNCTNSLPN
ncbi:hypothetical protein [Variovorax sp. ZT5P49]|uniref:hypothetical protein n=1 Tax=Variovorax sp. ZT5P49 TaxID=3443733 RepID=UPI003F49ABE5